MRRTQFSLEVKNVYKKQKHALSQTEHNILTHYQRHNIGENSFTFILECANQCAISYGTSYCTLVSPEVNEFYRQEFPRVPLHPSSPLLASSPLHPSSPLALLPVCPHTMCSWGRGKFVTRGRACLPFISQRARNQRLQELTLLLLPSPLCRVRESAQDEGCFYTTERSSRETVSRNTARVVAAVFPVVIKTLHFFFKGQLHFQLKLMT